MPVGRRSALGDPHPVPGRYLATKATCYSFAYQLKVILDPSAADPATASIPLTLNAVALTGIAFNTALTFV